MGLFAKSVSLFMKGLDKLWAMRVKRGMGKKGNTSKNCKFTDEELDTHYTG